MFTTHFRDILNVVHSSLAGLVTAASCRVVDISGSTSEFRLTWIARGFSRSITSLAHGDVKGEAVTFKCKNRTNKEHLSYL